MDGFPTDGYVDPKDGLTWNEERSCWLSVDEVAKIKREDARLARAATKTENRDRARTLAAFATDESVEYVLTLYADGVALSAIALGFKAKFEPDAKIATAYHHVDDILLDAEIRKNPFKKKAAYTRDEDGIAKLPYALVPEQAQEAR